MSDSKASSKPAPNPSQTTLWSWVLIGGALTAAGPVGIDMYLPSLPDIGRDLNAVVAETQQTVAAFLIGMAVGQLFYGPISDRIGRRLPALFGMALFVIGSIMCAVSTSVEMLIAARVVQALGACGGAVVARAATRDQFNHTETARMLSLFGLVSGLGPVLAPMLGGLLMQLGGWQLNFYVMAGLGAAIFVSTLFLMKESRSEETAVHARNEHPFLAYLGLLRNPRFFGYFASGGLNGAVLFTYISSAPDLLINSYGIAPEHFGMVFGFNAFGIIGAGQVNRMILRRMHPDRVLSLAGRFGVFAALVTTIGAFSGLDGRWVVLPPLFFTLMTFGLVQGNTMAGALSIDPRRAGSASALMGAGMFGIGAGISAITALFHDGTARPLALTIVVAMFFSTLIMHTLALPKKSNA